jgi:hypothetical protein
MYVHIFLTIISLVRPYILTNLCHLSLKFLVTEAETVFEILNFCSVLKQPIIHEDSIVCNHHKSFKSFMFLNLQLQLPLQLFRSSPICPLQM